MPAGPFDRSGLFEYLSKYIFQELVLDISHLFPSSGHRCLYSILCQLLGSELHMVFASFPSLSPFPLSYDVKQ